MNHMHQPDCIVLDHKASDCHSPLPYLNHKIKCHVYISCVCGRVAGVNYAAYVTKSHQVDRCFVVDFPMFKREISSFKLISLVMVSFLRAVSPRPYYPHVYYEGQYHKVKF